MKTLKKKFKTKIKFKFLKKCFLTANTNIVVVVAPLILNQNYGYS